MAIKFAHFCPIDFVNNTNTFWAPNMKWNSFDRIIRVKYCTFIVFEPIHKTKSTKSSIDSFCFWKFKRNNIDFFKTLVFTKSIAVSSYTKEKCPLRFNIKNKSNPIITANLQIWPRHENMHEKSPPNKHFVHCKKKCRDWYIRV